MQERVSKSDPATSRSAAHFDNEQTSSQNSVFTDNRPQLHASPLQLLKVNSSGIQVVQGEFATATATVAGTSATANSKNSYDDHWVTAAMNKAASVKPKRVPDGEGGWKEVTGNAKFQCAEPKSLSKALISGLDSDKKITKAEVDAIRLKDIKWCTGDRDGQAACLCPTCATWLEEDGAKGKAKPLAAAKNKVKSDGEDVGLYFDDNSARDEQR
ncbi:hypothetical protein N9355_02670 [Crocinitomicaceae bacterium]|nr:hypothetical protein [Crocinitomicaceae bacterium]